MFFFSPLLLTSYDFSRLRHHHRGDAVGRKRDRRSMRSAPSLTFLIFFLFDYFCFIPSFPPFLFLAWRGCFFLAQARGKKSTVSCFLAVKEKKRSVQMEGC
jgi:hypothetical protein